MNTPEDHQRQLFGLPRRTARKLAPLPLLRNPDPEFVAGRACGVDPTSADWSWNQFDETPNPEMESLRMEVRRLQNKIRHFQWALKELLDEDTSKGNADHLTDLR